MASATGDESSSISSTDVSSLSAFSSSSSSSSSSDDMTEGRTTVIPPFSLWNGSAWNGSLLNGETTADGNKDEYQMLEYQISIVVPPMFAIISIIGLAANLTVIFVIARVRRIRNSTNILVLSLAIADALFLTVCVPMTAVRYALMTWPFGEPLCRLVEYVQTSTAFVSIYTLMFMSLERYLAITRPITSITMLTARRTYKLAISSWVLTFVCMIPYLVYVQEYSYVYEGKNRTICINSLRIQLNKTPYRVFHAVFLVASYCIPLSLIILVYSLLIRRLLCSGSLQELHEGEDRKRKKKRGKEKLSEPSNDRQRNIRKSRRKATRMVISLILIFVICWTPLQVLLAVEAFTDLQKTVWIIWYQIASNCLAYMNSVANPIVYTLLSAKFRKALSRLTLCKGDRDDVVVLARTNIIKMRSRDQNLTVGSQETTGSLITTTISEKKPRML